MSGAHRDEGRASEAEALLCIQAVINVAEGGLQQSLQQSQIQSSGHGCGNSRTQPEAHDMLDEMDYFQLQKLVEEVNDQLQKVRGSNMLSRS